MKNVLITISIFFFFSCQNKTNKIEVEPFENSLNLKYAEGFSIDYKDDLTIISLKDAWKGQNTSYKYILYKNEEPIGYDDAIKIKVPIQSIACMSLTHIAFIEVLGLENSIVAVSGLEYSNSEKIKKLISDEKISEIGNEQAINYEILINKSPDIVMTYGINQTSNTYLNKLEKVGLKAVLNSEYMEVHPLGKAEWIKFVAAFYNKEKLADSIFNEIETEYASLVELTKTIKEKPTVFTGMPWNGDWYIAGAKSFQVQLFKDAGADYLWMNNEEKSSLVISKEIVYDEAKNADYWLNQNSYNSIATIIEFDERLANFNTIKNKKLYNNNLRVNSSSGNDYWELGTIKPHVVLKDLIKIFHPNLIKHELYYYKKLE